MDPAHILRMLIERLEPEVGEITLADFGYYGDEQPSLLAERVQSGKMHLAEGLRLATEALASGDPEQIERIALIAPTYEREGRERERRFSEDMRQAHERAARRTGGATRAAQQVEAASVIWAPWQARFRQLVDEGKSPSSARHIIEREMVRDGFVLPGSGKFPAPRTLAKWLR